MSILITHFYVGNNKLSYVKRLCIESFKVKNPTIEVKIWKPKVIYAGDMPWTTPEQKIPYVGPAYNVEGIEVDFEKIGFKNDVPENYKSDYFRLWVLYNLGGWYSDYDILFVKPLNLELKGFQICWTGYFCTGFLGSEPNIPILKELLETAQRKQLVDYQVVGPELFNLNFGNFDGLKKRCPEAHNFGGLVVDPFRSARVSDIWLERKTLPKESIGMHLFSGRELTARWENLILCWKDIERYDNTFTRCILGDEQLQSVLSKVQPTKTYGR